MMSICLSVSSQQFGSLFYSDCESLSEFYIYDVHLSVCQHYTIIGKQRALSLDIWPVPTKGVLYIIRVLMYVVKVFLQY